MTNRDLGLVAIACLTLSFVVGATLFLLFFKRSPSDVHGTDAAVLAEPTPLPPLEPEPNTEDDTDAEPHATRREAADAAQPRVHPTSSAVASHDSGTPMVARAKNLLIHPSGHEGLCMDYSLKKNALHLMRCHGKKNQRWTAAEDVGAAIRLVSGEGGCVVSAGTNGIESTMTLGDCGAGALRFKHFEDRRLEETQTGKCVTTRRFDHGTSLTLAPCDASNTGQLWTLE